MRISDWSSDVCSSDLVGFRRLGYRVSTAGSGADGIERLQPGHDVDVVALDHHMDGLNGLETLALIQHLSDPPPVVFVTGEVEGRVAISEIGRASCRERVCQYV